MESSSGLSRKSQSFWSVVRESIRGTQQDFTEATLGRAILLLATPMVLEMVMESLFGVVDVYFVAGLGADAITTVGLTEAMLALFFGVAMGLATAASAMVARRTGEKDAAGASVAAVHAIGLGLLVSSVIAICGITFARQLLQIMGASPSIVAAGHIYTAAMMGSTVVIMMIFVMNAIFRGAGDAAISMRVLWIANAINICLDPCFILGLGPFPKLGVLGAAVSTTIGRSIAVLFQLYMLFGAHGAARITISRRQLRVDWDVLKRLARIAATGMFQFLIATASWVGLTRLVSMFGSAAVAGYTIAIRIVVFAILPSWGLSNAAATLVGQNLGAGKPDRAEQAVWRTGFYNMMFLGTVGLIFVIFARPLIGAFSSEPAVVESGVSCLRFVSYGYVSYAWGMVMVQSFNGAGDTLTPTLINLCCYWFWQIPLAYTLALHFGFGAQGAYMAIAIAETTIAVAGILAFRRGRWKTQKV